MKVRKPSLALLASVGLVVLGATSLMAQRAGFRVGIAPTVGRPVVISGFGQPAVVPFGVAPAVPFGVAPVVPFGAQFGIFPQPFGFPTVQTPVIVTGGGFFPQPVVTQPFGGIVVQTPQVFVPGTAFAPGPFVVPGQVVVSGPIVWPRSIFIETPGAHVRPGQSIALPGVGTARSQVLNQLGHPTGSIVTSSGETLYFNGGISVFIQNGQVAVPK